MNLLNKNGENNQISKYLREYNLRKLQVLMNKLRASSSIN